MSITRKEFFRKGFLSLGRTALELAGTLTGGPSGSGPPEAGVTLPADPRPDMLAEPFNERCLARHCGCFACAERCEPQAIVVVPGEGIRVDGTRCSGCGTCEYVCPVLPKAVVLVPREKKL